MLKELMKEAESLVQPKRWPTWDNKGVLDRQDFLSSSETATCLRQLYFRKTFGGMGATNGFAERGSAIENWIVGRLRLLQARGYKFSYLGDEQRTFYDPDIGLSGTPDGLLLAPNGRYYGLEFKSIDPRANKSKLPKPGHIAQSRQNQILMQDCLGIKIEHMILTYFDASDLFNQLEFIVQLEPTSRAVLIDRAHRLWSAEGPDDLPAEGMLTDECERCPYTHQCSMTLELTQKAAAKKAVAENFSNALEDNPTPLGPVDIEEYIPNSEVLMAFETFIESRELAKQYADEVKAVDDIVRQTIMDNGGTVLFRKWLMMVREQGGRTTIDKKALTDAGIDLVEFEKRGAPFTVLTVKDTGEATA